MKKIATVSLAALALASCSDATPEPAALTMATAEDCANFDVSVLGGQDGSATWVEAAEEMPAFCEISATLTPVEGSTIGVVYRLPEAWNGKLLGLGGGGWAGNVTIQAAGEGLAKGYATLQTDGGNAGTDVWANSWVAERPASAEDFSHRAVHEMTVAGKSVASSFYGREHDRAYFQGCSTGGRMALMEAQRYPTDYDAIIAGAPVYTLQVQTSAVFRNQTFAAGGGAGGFSMEDLQLVQSSVLAMCDAADGLEDGIVNDPASCGWQPASLQCEAGKTATCLTAPQVTALQTIYDGVRASDGSWSMLPMRRGGEAGWSLFVGTDGAGNDATGGGGLANLAPLFFGSEKVSFSAFTDANYLAVRASPFAAMYEAKDPDLSAFFANGGRLMLWHGESDPGPSPVGTLDYAQAVMAGNAAAAEQFRYFTLPGVGHCRGGPGADMVDYVSAMDDWVSSGEAPARLIGTKADGSITRAHCAWPNVARFEGEGAGDANDPDKWTCVPRT
ncbi:tannase/feruloyl esterase family alpha/beta hydrolase [Alteraurantiacibacter aestuarii]|uniref:tannase/feruloyl esterase family alpha/beta hydrolase n=1 Tax=Alteraurantiacibacter aestuarii TaxID=650004 RepID=UPI0031D5F245